MPVFASKGTTKPKFMHLFESGSLRCFLWHPHIFSRAFLFAENKIPINNTEMIFDANFNQQVALALIIRSWSNFLWSSILPSQLQWYPHIWPRMNSYRSDKSLNKIFTVLLTPKIVVSIIFFIPIFTTRGASDP